MVKHLGLAGAWRYEIAAMLSQVGCVAFDSETVEAVYAGANLPAAELEHFKMHPSIAFDLLNRIPRLELVAAMVGGQQPPPPAKPPQQTPETIQSGELGAHLLKIAVDFDQFLLQGIPAKGAIEKLKSKPKEYYLSALIALETLSADTTPFIIQEVSIREMTTGMILDEDLRSHNGSLMVARNQEINYALLVRIRNLHEKSPFPDKIKVKVPQRGAPPTLDLNDLSVVQLTR
jgi:hypothetical protein